MRPDDWTRFEARVEDAVALVTFTREATLNSLTFEVYDDLVRLSAELAQDASVKALVITGRGRGFCSGGDVNAIMGPLLAGDAERVLAFTRTTCALVRNLRAMPQPVIAAVNGTAAGAGAVIALASDLRVVADGAKIHFLFTKVGLTGADMGAAWLLPRVIGAGRAAEALYFGEAITSDQALAWGLANRVVPTADVERTALDWARQLATGPREAIRMTKAGLRLEADMSFEAALEFEANAQALLLAGADHREFFESRGEGRPPRWRS